MGKIGKRRRTDVSDQEIVKSYEETKSVHAVARKFNIGSTTVYRVLERLGVQRVGLAIYRDKARKFDDVEAVALRSKYETGVSFADLVREFGGSEYSVKKAITNSGGSLIPVAPPGNDEEVKKICDMYASGMSQMKISLALGRSQSFVTRTLRKKGIQQRFRSGADHGMWTGGRTTDTNGYVRASIKNDDPFTTMRLSDGYVLEHRLVMARHLGRPLIRTETVHHINGDRSDNRIDNLQLRQGKHGKHSVMCCGACGSRNIVHTQLD